MFSSLGNRDFLLLWLGVLFNMAGSQMNQIARGFLVYQMTRSAKILGAVTVAEALPLIALSLFGGAIADRLDRKRLVQLGQGAAAAIAVFIAVSVTTDTITWLHLVAAAALQGATWSLTIPARHALVPQLVGRQLLGNAMALSGAGTSATVLLGPAIGGLLYAWTGPARLYYVVAALGLVSLAFTTLIHRPPGEKRPVVSPVLEDIKAGLRYIWHYRLVLVILLVSLGISLLTTPLRVLLPVVVVDVFHRDSKSLGLLLSMAGLGSLVASLAVASLGAWRRGLLFITAGVASAAALVLVAWVPMYLAAVAALVIFGLGEAGHRVLTQTLLMEQTEDIYRGRIMSVNEMRLGVVFLGGLPAGAAAESLGIETTLTLLGAAALVASVLVLFTQNSLRRLE